MSKKILREVEKINHIQKLTMGQNAKAIDNIGYIHYILNNGTPIERRQFLDCIEGQLYLKEGEVWLEKFKASKAIENTGIPVQVFA